MNPALKKMKIRSVQIAKLAAVSLPLLTGCAQLTTGYQITPRTSQHFPPTETVQIIKEEPARPYEILAEFIGHEPGDCPATKPLCTLRKRGKAAGADAIWIQEYIKTEHPGEWILINNKMTKIHPYTSETYRGVFIRYSEDQSR